MCACVHVFFELLREKKNTKQRMFFGHDKNLYMYIYIYKKMAKKRAHMHTLDFSSTLSMV